MKSRLQEKFNLLNIDELNTLNSYASYENRQICSNFIDMWREQGLLHGYFGIKCNNLYNRKRITNNDILELYIYYCMILFEDDVEEEEQNTFRYLADYYYKEGQKEVGIENPTDIPNKLMDELMDTPCVNGYTLDEYKGAKALNSTYQIHRQATMEIQQGKTPNVKNMEKEIEKEQNERLKVGDKVSGVIDMMLIGINNMAKVYGIEKGASRMDIDDVKVRFIAVMDERTTKMCESLDGQTFSVHGQNKFVRYSDMDKNYKQYTCNGLVLGLNLPPVSNNFHFCRSTIEYIR